LNFTTSHDLFKLYLVVCGMMVDEGDVDMKENLGGV
jgi:hypothetical protein